MAQRDQKGEENKNIIIGVLCLFIQINKVRELVKGNERMDILLLPFLFNNVHRSILLKQSKWYVKEG